MAHKRETKTTCRVLQGASLKTSIAHPQDANLRSHDCVVVFEPPKESAFRCDHAEPDVRYLSAVGWEVLKYFRAGEHTYVIARKNRAKSPLQVFTSRERQVAEKLMLGISNKLIAYELGISSSTVNVLIHRAAAKLRVRGRRELAEALRRKDSS